MRKARKNTGRHPHAFAVNNRRAIGCGCIRGISLADGFDLAVFNQHSRAIDNAAVIGNDFGIKNGKVIRRQSAGRGEQGCARQ